MRPKRVCPFFLLRVTLGTDAEMARFPDVFWKVYKGRSATSNDTSP